MNKASISIRAKIGRFLKKKIKNREKIIENREVFREVVKIDLFKNMRKLTTFIRPHLPSLLTIHQRQYHL